MSDWFTHKIVLAAVCLTAGWGVTASFDVMFRHLRGKNWGGCGGGLFKCTGGFTTHYRGIDERVHMGLLCDTCGKIIDTDKPPMKTPLSEALAPARAETLFIRQMRARGLPHDDLSLNAFLLANGYPEGTTRANLRVEYSLTPGNQRERDALYKRAEKA